MNIILNTNQGINQYYARQPSIPIQVTNSANASSFDYSTQSNHHPAEIVVEPPDIKRKNKRRKASKEYYLKRVPSEMDYYNVFHLFGQAFEDFTYLLPGLKPFLTCAPVSFTFLHRLVLVLLKSMILF